jgi:hypothetical protein
LLIHHDLVKGVSGFVEKLDDASAQFLVGQLRARDVLFGE